MSKELSQFLSVIVPTRNEGHSILFLLERLRYVVPEAEVWLIDGGNDDTPTRVSSLKNQWQTFNYLRHENDRGKGHAIQTGIQKATRPLIAQIDADLQFDPEDLLPLVQCLYADQADFVCGSRFLPLSKKQMGSVSGLRFFGNRLFSVYTSLLLQKSFSDVLTGIKAWKREVTAAFVLRSDSFSYEVELPVKAHRLGFRVTDIAVGTAPRQQGQSSVNILKTGLSLLKDIPRFCWEPF